jgi:hypothetical protein
MTLLGLRSTAYTMGLEVARLIETRHLVFPRLVGSSDTPARIEYRFFSPLLNVTDDLETGFWFFIIHGLCHS